MVGPEVDSLSEGFGNRQAGFYEIVASKRAGGLVLILGYPLARNGRRGEKG